MDSLVNSTVAQASLLHPFLSDTVTQYSVVLTGFIFMAALVCPLSHTKVVPPDAIRVIVSPSVTERAEEEEAIEANGRVCTVTGAIRVTEHPFKE